MMLPAPGGLAYTKGCHVLGVFWDREGPCIGSLVFLALVSAWMEGNTCHFVLWFPFLLLLHCIEFVMHTINLV
jgi:hypothetical protein